MARLDEIRLWDGNTTVYVQGIAVPIKCTSIMILPPSVTLSSDKRLIIAMDAYGVPYTLYHSSLGFSKVRLEDV